MYGVLVLSRFHMREKHAHTRGMIIINQHTSVYLTESSRNAVTAQ